MSPLRSAAQACLWITAAVFSLAVALTGQTTVLTYHYDNNRTGWNSGETVLTPANVNGSTFGLLTTVTLDDQVDAQPLLVSGVNITAGNYKGLHNVVYVATENDTVYAIDAKAGTILLTNHLGTPVVWPLSCNNNGPNVGINSTPVIDPVTSTLYLIAYTQGNTGPAYWLHALDLGSLTDKIAPELVSASHPLSDGTTFYFNATYQRQRPALLQANGNIYAGFGSFCDYAPNLSRGWLMGWSAQTLEPLSSDLIFNTQTSTPNDYFMASIWMSGYGPATDDQGNIIFVTGNSDPSGANYDGITSIQESVVKVNPGLSAVLDLFTPDLQPQLDAHDNDFGSGGALVLPDQPGTVPHLIVAAGKNGSMYLMNGDHLGGFNPTKNNVLGTYGIGGCWCGQSYYVDPVDGIARVVTSGGKAVEVWKLVTSPKTGLTKISTSAAMVSGQSPGFFTSISSNGHANPIVWALSHPWSQKSNSISLYAFNPETTPAMTTLYQASAGSWPNYNGSSNLVPVVANGMVYVASYKQLSIFGLKSQTK